MISDQATGCSWACMPFSSGLAGGFNAVMTSLDRHITRYPVNSRISLHTVCPILYHGHPLLSAQRSGFLSCLHETKAVSFRPQRCHRFRIPRTFSSTGHRTAAIATAMVSSTPHRIIEIIEGSQLQERPDSTHEMFLYTHMLCPYAQTALLTLLQLVRKVDFTPPQLSEVLP